MLNDDLNVRNRIGIRFALIARSWRRSLDRVFAELGLTDATWAPLIHLADGDGISQKNLAFRVGVEPSTLVRLLDILEENKLVERQPDKADRRSRQVFLSKSGRAVLADMRGAQSARENEILSDFSDAELAVLSKLLTKIESRLSLFGPE